MEELMASGISEEVVAAAKIESIDAPEAAVRLQRRNCPSGGLAYVYFDLAGKEAFTRVKLDTPIVGKDGKPRKYESPVGCVQCLFLPPQTITLLDDKSLPLVYTEGEKKALAVVSAGLPAVAVPGVNGFGKRSREAAAKDPNFPSLTNLDLKGREVFIAFDSDAVTNKQVRRAEDALFLDLLLAQATPRVIRIPSAPDGSKQGIDDYLVRAGGNACESLKGLMDQSRVAPIINAGNDKEEPPTQYEIACSYLADRRDAEGSSLLRTHHDDCYLYGRNKFRKVSDADVREDVFTYMKDLVPPKQQTYKNCEAITKVVKILSHVSSRRSIPFFVSSADEGPNRDVIALRNTLLDIGGLMRGASDFRRPLTPDWFSTVALGFDFDVSADCPRWKRFLGEVLEGDLQRIRSIQMFFGYCLTADFSQQKALILVGRGSNGKSIVLQILAAVLGETNVSSVPLQAFAARFALAATVGKLANIVAECSELDRHTEAALKAFITSDWMTLDRKNKEPLQVRPTAKLIVGTNSVPRFADKTDGIWRRLLIIPFNVQISEDRQDKNLLYKLRGELAGIFLWSLVGLFMLRKVGRFPESKLSSEMLRDCRLESNPILRFFDEHVEACPTKSVPCDKLYDFYKTWTNVYGYRAMSEGSFGKELKQRFKFDRKRASNRGVRTWVYDGLLVHPHARYPM